MLDMYLIRGADDKITYEFIKTFNDKSEIRDYIHHNQSVDMGKQFLHQRNAALLPWYRHNCLLSWDRIATFGSRETYVSPFPLERNFFGGYLIEEKL